MFSVVSGQQHWQTEFQDGSWGPNVLIPGAPIGPSAITAAENAAGNTQVFTVINGIEHWHTLFSNNQWGPGRPRAGGVEWHG